MLAKVGLVFLLGFGESAFGALIGRPIEGYAARQIYDGLLAFGAIPDLHGTLEVRDFLCEKFFSLSSYHCLMRDLNNDGQVIQGISEPAKQLFSALAWTVYPGSNLDFPQRREWYQAFGYSCQREPRVICYFYNGDDSGPTTPNPVPTVPVPSSEYL